MIKINLVAEGRKPVIARQTSKSGGGLFTGENAALITAGIVALILGLVLFGYYWSLRSTINDNSQRIATAQQRVNELQAVIERVEQFENKEIELKTKVSVINGLKNDQRGPVETMDAISRALPERLWLDRLEMRGTNVTMAGRSYNTRAISNFVRALDSVATEDGRRIFSEPVLGDINQARDLYIFQLQVDRVPPPPEPVAETEPEPQEAAP